MAADVSSLIRMLNGFNEEQHHHHHHHHHQPTTKIEESSSGSSELITRDLLGSCSRSETKELDLELQVPTGWEQRLDLKSGAVYLQRSDRSSNSSSSSMPSSSSKSYPELQDLNLPPASSTSKTLQLEFEKRLDLKLVTSSHDYQSVCTLDMVKSALKRADQKKKLHLQKRSCSIDGGSSSSSSGLTLLKEEDQEEKIRSPSSSSSYNNNNYSSSSLFAAGCSNCLMYVLMSKTNPKCPRCDTIVPSPTINNKKPRIDLNTFSD